MRAFARPLPTVQGDLQGRTRQPRRGKNNGDDAVAPPVFFSHSMGDVVVARQVRFSSLSSAPSSSSSAMASERWHAQIRALPSRARARAFPRENKKREQRPLSLSLFPSFSKPRPRRGKKVKGRSLALSFSLDRSEDAAEERRVPPIIRPASNRPLHSHAPARERSSLPQDCSSGDERTQESQARLLAKRHRSDFDFDVCCRCCCLVDRRRRRRRHEERRQRRPALVPPCPGLPQPRDRRFL